MTDDDVCKTPCDTPYIGKRSRCVTKLGGEAEGTGCRDSSTREQACDCRRCLARRYACAVFRSLFTRCTLIHSQFCVFAKNLTHSPCQ